jgi:hypothetical protein
VLEVLGGGFLVVIIMSFFLCWLVGSIFEGILVFLAMLCPYIQKIVSVIVLTPRKKQKQYHTPFLTKFGFRNCPHG